MSKASEEAGFAGQATRRRLLRPMPHAQNGWLKSVRLIRPHRGEGEV